MSKLFKFAPFIFLVSIVLFFFNKFLAIGFLPIPSDTIVGLYHPFRDFFIKEYPRGIPFKNFLITDPIRQQYPWREISIALEKTFQFPLWNPYSFSGTPLLANLQSAAFYPLNFLFFIFPFNFTWGFLVLLQPLLASLFMYFYLNNLRLKKIASLVGSMVFAFSGFSIAWLEWNTVLHAILWLPLLLLCVDKIFLIKGRKVLLWAIIFVFSLSSSFFAGYLQIFFYLFLVLIIYIFLRWVQFEKKKKYFFIFLSCILIFAVITSFQWFPTAQFILLSARTVDQIDWMKQGWFVPWQNLIQFISPDFFGNPATLNYWGVWNYAELVGYIGIFPLIISIFALFFRHDKKTLFFGTIFFLSLIFALPTFFAKIPFILQIPFISTSQPTRLLFLTDFSLAMLSALGLDYFLKKIKKQIILPIIFVAIAFIGLWVFILMGNNFLKLISPENLLVSKRNLYYPSLIFGISSITMIMILFFSKRKKIVFFLSLILLVITVFDLTRFGFKFTPFNPKNYLFPQTKTLAFLKDNQGQYRYMTTDSRIMAPNFSVVYRLQGLDGYDPLYSLRYGKFIAASERGKPDINTPFGFNRIITPHNFDSKIIDLLGVKYILSLSEISSPKLKKVFQEGETRIYQNLNVFPRTFFVWNLEKVNGEKEAITTIFEKDLSKTAIIESDKDLNQIPDLSVGKAKIIYFSENKVIVETENNGQGFLVLTDSFYPSWKVMVDNKLSKIVRTDFNLRGVFVPKGKHVVEFKDHIF